MQILDLDDATFDKAVAASSADLLLIDFWADWCGPCVGLAPIVHKFADANPDVQVIKVDTNVAMKIPTRFGVQNLPALMFVDRKTGNVLSEARGMNATARNIAAQHTVAVGKLGS